MSESVRRVALTERELQLVCRALAEAISDARKFENVAAFSEYKPGTRYGFVEIDDDAMLKNAETAHALLARLLSDSWGLATLDSGIVATRTTRTAAVEAAGFATPYRREKRGRLWEYTSDGGGCVAIGRIADLIRAGFEFSCARGGGEK